ncbi:MAG: helix-turn-helix domain-containing protein [Firmicutes bacterium]|nr:helix-turn-helix domain-containing protein [Bacillota bacterium]
MTLREILKQYKEKTQVTNDYIAAQVGVNKSTVSRWLKEDMKVMKPEVIERLSFLLGMDVEALLKDTDLYRKPILGVAKAGYGLFAQENLEGYEDVSKQDFYRGDYFLRVSGDSMTGAHIHDQDLIYVKQTNIVPSGTIAVILIGNEEVTIKRLIKKEDLWILEAANPEVGNRYFSAKEVENLPVRVIGKVLYSRSDFE